jgi:soluble lytic murein transglycosylase
LQKNPNQPDLLLMVARHGLYLSGYTDYLDRLTQQYASRLTPADWEAIGFGYWEKQLYGKAGMAYAKAPYTAHTAYRTGRGMQLGNLPGAVAAYQRLVNDFPKAEETSLGLIRMAQMLDPQPAIAALDQVISRYPDRAAQALLEKSRLLDKLNNKTAAAQARQTLLSRYSQSDAAAELRWSLAQEQAEAGNLQAAKTWAEPILKQNPDSEYAPEAGFWLGKWASQLGKHKDAQLAYEAVLSQYPESYYAWRSAAMLGWTVGDFMTVRELNPAVERPAVRPELPVGSATLRELYQLGQDRDAWALWQTEFQNPMQPTVAEQFTDGIMRLGVGDYLDGIFMVSYLSQREDQQDRQQYHQLKQQRSYWQALYPFPFLEPIEQFSQERQLNPLLVTALIRQESRFMPGIQSSAGAVGLMQVMPDTGAWVAKNIQLKEYKLNDPEDNIKLGTWYLDYTHAEFSGNSMLAIASYNAGPGAVLDWVAQKGITDPDQFVEAIPYDETRGYVKSVFANYWNYLRLYNPEISQKLAQVSQHHPSDQGS